MADVEVDELNEAYGRMKDSPTALINIIDLNFNELVYDPDKSKMMSKSDAVKTYVKTLIDDYNTNGNKATELTTSTGDTRIASCEKYEPANWLVCSVNSMSDYDTMLNSALSSQVILSIVFIVVIVSILIFTITRALKPISIIQSGLNNVFKFINHESKDANTINVKTKDEFGA
ncbi:methyl-accepting chemotaxis protein, partial [Campylobacter sputorum subsp. sputorum]